MVEKEAKELVVRREGVSREEVEEDALVLELEEKGVRLLPWMMW